MSIYCNLRILSSLVPASCGKVNLVAYPGRGLASHSSLFKRAQNPILPSSQQELIRSQSDIDKKILNKAISFQGSSQKDPSLLVYFRSLGSISPPIIEEREFTDLRRPYDIKGHDEMVEFYESIGGVPKNKMAEWALSYLNSSYSNPNVVLQMLKVTEPDSSTPLIRGVAHGILAAWANKLHEQLAEKRIDFDTNRQYRKLFPEAGKLPILDTAERNGKENLKRSLEALEEAHRLNPLDPNAIFYFLTQLLDEGNTLSAVKSASRYIEKISEKNLHYLTFDELRALLVSSAISGTALPLSEFETVLERQLSSKQQLEDLTEAIEFIEKNGGSDRAAEIAKFLRKFA